MVRSQKGKLYNERYGFHKEIKYVLTSNNTGIYSKLIRISKEFLEFKIGNRLRF